MSLALSRPLLRQRSALRLSPSRRFESTTTKAAEAAKDTTAKAQQLASDYTSKASQGLSRVTSAAGPALAGAARGVSNALGRVGGRTGRLIGFVQRQVPTVVHYSRVGIELSKLVFRGQNMSPPPIGTFQTYYQSAWKTLRQPGSLPNVTPASIMQQVRNVSRAQMVAGGVLLAECIGFFTVGEMAGRVKLIGYHGEGATAHH